MTNAAHPAIGSLFGKLGKPISFERTSRVGGKLAKRDIIREFVFSNIGDLRNEY